MTPMAPELMLPLMLLSQPMPKSTLQGRSGAFDDCACADAVYRRANFGICGWGPLPVTASEHEGGDVTREGVVNLAGSINETLSDSFASFESDCWRAATLLLPQCNLDKSPLTGRGGGWLSDSDQLSVSYRSPAIEGLSPNGGFRCVRSGTP